MTLWERTRCAIRDGKLDLLPELESEVRGDPSLSTDLRTAIEAQIIAARGDSDGARQRLVAASKERPLGPHEKLILGHLLLEKSTEALELFREAERAGLQDPRLAEGIGIAEIDLGNVNEGIRRLETSLEKDETNWSARFALGVALSNLGDRDAARTEFEELVRHRPQDSRACIAFADHAIATGKAAEASRVLGPVAQTHQDSDQIQVAYALCVAYAGDLKKALSILGPVANRTSEITFLLDYAEMSIKAGVLDLAERILAKISAISPDAPPMWHLGGILAERRGDANAAVYAYRKALAVDPNYLRGKNSLALILMRENAHKDYDAAELLLRSIADTKSSEGLAAMANLALLRLLQGNRKAAREMALRVLVAKPKYPAVIDQAQRIMLERNVD